MMALLDTIRRIWFGATPFDRSMLVIEVLVLALIAYELASDRAHQWKLRHRSKKLHRLFVEGELLADDAPLNAATVRSADQWMIRAEEWGMRTGKQLGKYSEHALVKFMYARPLRTGVVAFEVNPEARAQYVQLREQLDNLLAIIERPDVYF